MYCTSLDDPKPNRPAEVLPSPRHLSSTSQPQSAGLSRKRHFFGVPSNDLLRVGSTATMKRGVLESEHV